MAEFKIPVALEGEFKSVDTSAIQKQFRAIGINLAAQLNDAFDLGVQGISRSLERLGKSGVPKEFFNSFVQGLPDVVQKYNNVVNQIDASVKKLFSAASGERQRNKRGQFISSKQTIAEFRAQLEGVFSLVTNAPDQAEKLKQGLIEKFGLTSKDVESLNFKDLSRLIQSRLVLAIDEAAKQGKSLSKTLQNITEEANSKLNQIGQTTTTSRGELIDTIDLERRGKEAERALAREEIVNDTRARIAQEDLDKRRKEFDILRELDEARAKSEEATNKRRKRDILSRGRISAAQTGQVDVSREVSKQTSVIRGITTALNKLQTIDPTADISRNLQVVKEIQTNIVEESDKVRKALIAAMRTDDPERLAKILNVIEARLERIRQTGGILDTIFADTNRELESTKAFHANIADATSARVKATKEEIGAARAVVAEQRKAATILRKFDRLHAEDQRLVDPKSIQDLRDFAALNPLDEAKRRITEAGGSIKGVIDRDVTRPMRDAADASIRTAHTIGTTTLSIQKFGAQAALAFKRYSAFLVGTFALYQIGAAFRFGVREALSFEQQITKIQQVLDDTPLGVQPIASSIRSNARRTGVNPTQLAEGVQIFAQAGFKDVEQLARVTEKLANIPLSATFGDIKDTAEGLIAVYQQFNLTLDDTGRILDVVNQFSKDFAVESADIFEGVKRGGAAFAVAGGNLEEFIELFSILRDRTRESAETIGTFFKTGLAQILKPRSQNFLKSLGIDTDQRVVDQLTQLSDTLFGENSQFSNVQKILIAQQVTGERQFNKFLALLQAIQDPEVSKRRQNALSNAFGSIDRDVVQRVDDLGVSLNKIKTSFLDIVLSIGQDEGFKQFIQLLSQVSTTVLDLAKNFKDILPLIGAFGTALAFKAGGKVASVALRELGILRTSLATGGLEFAGFGLKGAGRRRLLTAGGLGVAALGAGIVGNNTDNRGVQTAAGAAQSGLLTSVSLLALSINPVVAGLAGLAVGTYQLISGFNRLNKEAIAVKEAERQRERNRKVLEQAQSGQGSEAFKSLFGGIGSAEFKQRTIAGAPSRLTQTVLSLFGLNPLKELTTNTELSRQQFDIGRQSIPVNKFNSALNNNLFFDAILPALNKQVADFIRSANISNLPEDEIRERVIEQFQPQFAGILDSGQIRQLFGLTSIPKELVGVSGELLHVIRNFTISLETAFRELDTTLLHSGERLNAALDVLNTFNPDVTGTSRLRNLTNQSDLFSAFGLSSFRQQLINPGEQINKFLSTGVGGSNIQTLLKLYSKSANATIDEAEFRGFGQFIDQILSDNGASKEFRDRIIRDYEGLFESLAGVTGKDVVELVSSLGDLTESELRFLENEVAGKFGSVIDRLEEHLRKAREAFQLGIERQREFNDAIRATNDTIFNLTQQFNNLTRAAADRQTEQSLFAQNASTDKILQAQVQSLVSGANTSGFGNTGTFIQDFLRASQEALTASERLSTEQRGPGILSFEREQQLVIDRENANNRFLDLQQELNQRLSELQNRIGQAAQASDLLKQAIISFRDGLSNAGSSVRQFTTKDLADAFGSLRRFAAGGGSGNVLGGIGNLRSGDLDRITNLLGLVQGLPLGGGITGGDLLGKINQPFGETLLASIRSILNNTDFATEQANVRSELAALQQQQAAAAALEQQLRQQQIQLTQAQLQATQSNQQFLQGQLTELMGIRQAIENNTDIQVIRDKVNNLFQVPLLITSDPNVTRDALKAIAPAIVPQTSTPNITAPNSNLPRGPQTIGPPPTPIGPLFPTRLPREYPNQPFLPIGPGILTPPNIDLDSLRPKRYPDFDPNSIPKSPFIKPYDGPMSGRSNVIGADQALGVLNDIKDLLQRTSTIQSQLSFTVEITPIQVNVALTAPDVLKMIGPTVRSGIMSEIGVKLSEVFGSDPEIAGRISSEFNGS